MKIVVRLLSVAVLCGAILQFVGCSTQQEFNSDLFEESVVLSGVARDLGVGECNPEDMWVVQDSMVVINNKGSRDSMFMVVSGSNWSVLQIFGNRRGGFAKPEIVKNSDKIMVYDQFHNSFTAVSTHGELSRLQAGLSEEDVPSEISCIGGVYYYKTTPFNAADVIMKRDKHNSTQLHDFMPQLQATRTPYGYSGSMVVSPCGGKFLYAYKYLRRFDIFNSNGKVLSVNLDSTAPSIAMKSSGGVDVVNSNICYASASVSADRIYLYYIGESENGLRGAGDVVTYVEEFDWDGNPLKRYQLGGVYSSVMYINGSFVAITPSGESRFVTYDIK